MALEVGPFWLPRRGNRPDEYEDAFASLPASGRYAMADGATESSFAGSWARLLVEEYVRVGEEDWPRGLAEVQKRWRAELRGVAVPWYAEAKLEEGAFAAFLGLVLSSLPERGDVWWRAVAVGDVCLFHTRDDGLLDAFPVTRSSDFTSLPPLLGSRVPAAHYTEARIVRREGRIRPGDRLWMMTDALAEWFLVEHEAGRRPWDEIAPLGTVPGRQERFARWIEGLRDAKRLRNDDVTMWTAEF